MKKIISIFSIFFISKNVLAIESNHSYFKNSDFTNNYSVEVKGLGDFNLFYNNERVNSKTSEFFDRDVSVVLNTVLTPVMFRFLRLFSPFISSKKEES